MTTHLPKVKLFDETVIDERVEYGVLFRLYAGRIFYVKLPDFQEVSQEILAAGYQFLNDHGGGKFYNIYELSSFTDISEDVRAWAADEAGNKYTHTDAYVISSLGQKILGDFYMTFNKPIVPTKIFFSRDKAYLWTIEQMNLMDKKVS